MMESVIFIVYAALSYWAVGQTIFANKIRIGTWDNLIFNRLFVGLLFGWILIPVALIKKLFFHG